MQSSMRFCPYCGERLRRQPEQCPHCGEKLAGHFPRVRTTAPEFLWGFEYRSPQEVLGMPLIHIAQGFNPETRLPRVARGFIAIGGFAVGVFAIGGFAAGVFVFSGIGVGLLAIGGIAMGAFALGGIALGLFFALGGLAISLRHAFGALPITILGLRGIGSFSQLRDLLARLLR